MSVWPEVTSCSHKAKKKPRWMDKNKLSVMPAHVLQSH